MKFIYWFSYYNTDSPSVRYRAQYPLAFFRARFGIESYFITPGYHPAVIFKFIKAYLSAMFFRKEDSIIVIQRINSNFIYANLLKLLVKFRNKHTVYDLDDADFLEFPPGTIYHFIKNCSSLTVGSYELKKRLSQRNQNIVLNTSPVPGIGILKQFKNDLLTIGWIGGFGGGHKTSLLKYFFPALKNLPFKIRLVILGVSDQENFDFLIHYFSDFKDVILDIPRNINWKDERFIQNYIAAFDVGIATLLNTEAQRSKSAFKLKQYMNNGVPVLSSNIAENNLFLEEGKNGFLCTTIEDFRKRIFDFYHMDQHSYMQFSGYAKGTTLLFDHVLYLKNLTAVFEISKHGKTSFVAQQDRVFEEHTH